MSYTPTGKPLDITRALASEVRDEFQLVATAINEFPDSSDIVAGRANYAADTGSANAYSVAVDALVVSYAAGLTLLVKAANANTGASTINVNSLGIRQIVRANGTALQSGDIVAGQIFQISYDLANTRFQLSATGAAASATAAASSASAAASSASAAATSASDAGLSELNSARSANDSIALYDNFDRRYLGDKSSAPSLDNQGNALIVGAIYFDSVLAIMRVWTGSSWVNAANDNDAVAKFTNKRIQARIGTVTSSATPTINTNNVDVFQITALAANITSMSANLSGSPDNSDVLLIEITGTATRTIAWGASFEASTVALPVTTVSTNKLTVGFIWNSTTSKWRCVAVC